jgi:hypothetical protein
LPKTFFMHIGKTAGSAVNEMLHSHFGIRFIDHIEAKPDWKERLESYDCLSGHFHYGSFRQAVNGQSFRYITVMREPLEQFRSHLNWLRVLGANSSLRVNTPPHILVLSDELADIDLNDPERVYRFLSREEDSVHRVGLLDNGQARYFLGDHFGRRFGLSDFKEAISCMERFNFVGVTENPLGIVSGIKLTLAIDRELRLSSANVQKYNRKFDREAWRKILGDWFAYDCALYELARINSPRRD